MAFDSSENPQKEPQSAQVSVPRSMVEHGRVGIPGNFRVRTYARAMLTAGVLNCSIMYCESMPCLI
jgi:hypothetical protein